MGLFDKKFCSVCNAKIGLLGNRKLEDGNLCKDCAKKLSVWFDERRHSTVDQINEQLAYREQNEAKLKDFDPTITIGEKNFVSVDERTRKFVVTKTKDIFSENPDLLDLSQVTGCELKINEHKTEQKHTVDGKSVNYNPPRYRMTYEFYIIIRVKHQYFDELKFELNNDCVIVDYQESSVGNIFGGRTNINSTPPVMAVYQRYEQMGQDIKAVIMGNRLGT